MLHNDFRYPVPSYQHVTYNPVVYSALSVSSSYSLQRVKLLGERKKTRDDFEKGQIILSKIHSYLCQCRAIKFERRYTEVDVDVCWVIDRAVTFIRSVKRWIGPQGVLVQLAKRLPRHKKQTFFYFNFCCKFRFSTKMTTQRCSSEMVSLAP